jgi:hypothetical protein
MGPLLIHISFIVLKDMLYARDDALGWSQSSSAKCSRFYKQYAWEIDDAFDEC